MDKEKERDHICHRKMNIPELIAACKEFLVSHGYSSYVLRSSQWIWNQLLKYADKNGESVFSVRLGEDFAKDHYGISKEDINHGYKATVLRTLRMLSDYQLHGVIYRSAKRKHFKWPKQFERLFTEHICQYSQGVCQSTVVRTRYDLERFAEYLDHQGVKDFGDVRISDIHGYTASLQQYSQSTVGNILIRVRALCKYAFEKGYHPKDLSLLIRNVRCLKNNYVPTTYTQDEIARLLNAVDRGNAIGKRNYAVLLLAVKFGMRAGDIRDLKLENLKWDTGHIEFTQNKTEEIVNLPMLEDVGFAIVDYLKNGRPHTDSTNLFVDHRAPFQGFSCNNSMYGIMGKYLKIAKIKTEHRNRGIHALRHSLASTLLEENIPLPVISEILGHSVSNDTSTYLKIDIKHLRQCALEVPV